MSKRAKTDQATENDEKAPRVIYAQVVDSDELEEDQQSGEGSQLDDASFLQDLPVKRKRKLVEPDTTLLTRHFQLKKEFPPLYTGGKFLVSKDF